MRARLQGGFQGRGQRFRRGREGLELENSLYGTHGDYESPEIPPEARPKSIEKGQTPKTAPAGEMPETAPAGETPPKGRPGKK
jgi:hypothetical protein